MEKNLHSILYDFVKANQNFVACVERIDHTKYLKSEGGQTAGLCAPEKQKIKEILLSNKMTMTQLVKDRSAKLRAMEKIVVDKPHDSDLLHFKHFDNVNDEED